MASSEARTRRRRPRRSVAAGTVLAAAAAALLISAGDASSAALSSPAALAAFSSSSTSASFSPAGRRLARRRADCGIVHVSDPLATTTTTTSGGRGVRPLLAADGDGGGDSEKSSSSRRERIRSKVKSFAKSLVSPKGGGGGGGSPGGSSASDKLPLPLPSPSSVLPSPRAVAEIIQDGALGTVEEVLTPAVEAGRQAAAARGINLPAPPLRLPAAFFPPGDATKVEAVERAASAEGSAAAAIDAVALAKTTASDAFASAEDAIAQAERALGGARRALAEAKTEAAEAIGKAEEAAVKASESASRATRLATEAAKEATDGAGEAAAAAAAATEVPVKDSDAAATTAQEAATEEGVAVDVSEMGYDDVDYHLSEMAPPFIGEDQCLVPGEAVVRVEKAPDNSRRIFAGIDIMASVDDVWKVLTAYDKLQEVVPNLVVNDVVELYERDATAPSNSYDPSKPDELQCREISTHMRGAKLRQVGGAKVVGINFSARTTLEVREWPEGMPDFAHYSDEVYDGKSRDARARAAKKLKLRRYRFPRPFALSTLPTRDISMQSVEDDDGEFRLYQGVWRMQPLPGCAPEGEHAMRLTYAVEISPRPYLPVALVEGRIAQDLCTNLRAIRDHVSR